MNSFGNRTGAQNLYTVHARDATLQIDISRTMPLHSFVSLSFAMFISQIYDTNSNESPPSKFPGGESHPYLKKETLVLKNISRSLRLYSPDVT